MLATQQIEHTGTLANVHPHCVFGWRVSFVLGKSICVGGLLFDHEPDEFWWCYLVCDLDSQYLHSLSVLDWAPLVMLTLGLPYCKACNHRLWKYVGKRRVTSQERSWTDSSTESATSSPRFAFLFDSFAFQWQRSTSEVSDLPKVAHKWFDGRMGKRTKRWRIALEPTESSQCSFVTRVVWLALIGLSLNISLCLSMVRSTRREWSWVRPHPSCDSTSLLIKFSFSTSLSLHIYYST